MNYREEIKTSQKSKIQYRDAIENIIIKRQEEAKQIRKEYIKDIFKTPEKYRNDLKDMLGWPLNTKRPDNAPVPKIKQLTVENDYTIYRMSFEILDGIVMTGLLFKKNDDKKRPMIIAQHGKLGTPELMSGIYGDTANYNNMVERIIKYDINIFAPQMLLWDTAVYGAEYNREVIDTRLKRVGSSVTAIEIYGIIRILDYFQMQDYVSNFGMIGLSYGGFFTLFTAAVDTRIKSSLSSSYFNDADSFYIFSDWVWQNAAFRFKNAEIACLVYPRNICIQMGKNDEVFDYRGAVSEFERVKEISSEVGTDWVDFVLFEGRHEFNKDSDEYIKKLIDDLA